jgi:hypothetical protein
LAAELPDVLLLDPEDGQPFAYGDGSTPHAQTLSISATNLVLGSMQGASEAVIGEGYLVVFVDEVEVGVIDSGDLGGGVQMDVEIPDVPGVHRIRVQARLHDGTDYDNESGAVRSLVWVDDGREHVALRRPWPNDAFSLESQKIEAEIAVFGGLQIGPVEVEVCTAKPPRDQPQCDEDVPIRRRRTARDPLGEPTPFLGRGLLFKPIT